MMTDGNHIQDWVKAAEISKKHGREPFFGVFIQAYVDDGTYLTVVFNKADDTAMKGGIPATKGQIDKLKELGVTIKDGGE